MPLSEKTMRRRYHALDYDWTPLSRNPCWLSNAAHHYSIYMKRNRFALFHLRYYRQRFCEYHKLRCCFDKSFADDLVESGYCKCESSLVLRSTEIFPALLRFVLPLYSNLIMRKDLVPIGATPRAAKSVSVRFAYDFPPLKLTTSPP